MTDLRPPWVDYAFDVPVSGCYAVGFRDEEVIRRLRARPMTLAELAVDFEPPAGAVDEPLRLDQRERRIGPVLRRLARQGRVQALQSSSGGTKMWLA